MESNPKIVKQFKYFIVIEDDFGFSVRFAITFSIVGASGFVALHKILKAAREEGETVFEMNESTKDTGLTYEDALLLAMNCEKAIRIQKGEITTSTKNKKKRKS